MSTVDVVAMSSEGVPTLTDEYQLLFLFFQVKLIRHSCYNIYKIAKFTGLHSHG